MALAIPDSETTQRPLERTPDGRRNPWLAERRPVRLSPPCFQRCWPRKMRNVLDTVLEKAHKETLRVLRIICCLILLENSALEAEADPAESLIGSVWHAILRVTLRGGDLLLSTPTLALEDRLDHQPDRTAFRLCGFAQGLRVDSAVGQRRFAQDICSPSTAACLCRRPSRQNTFTEKQYQKLARRADFWCTLLSTLIT